MKETQTNTELGNFIKENNINTTNTFVITSIKCSSFHFIELPFDIYLHANRMFCGHKPEIYISINKYKMMHSSLLSEDVIKSKILADSSSKVLVIK